MVKEKVEREEFEALFNPPAPEDPQPPMSGDSQMPGSDFGEPSFESGEQPSQEPKVILEDPVAPKINPSDLDLI